MDDSDDDVVQVSPCKRYSRCNEILGRGAFKTVYKGFDEVDGIEVAWNQVSIDETLQSPEHLEMLYAEVHLLKTLKHEKIIKSYMSWVDLENKTINMITELFTSGNLRQYRRKHRTVDVKAIKHWARQILHGLHYLHSHDPPIIHRDLKCDNIFINGNHGEVKLGDLGLATIMLQPTARSVIGTPEFMAPELYDEEYNERVDIYSFGMCILELVTCEYPYSECKNAAQIFKMVTSGLKPAALAKVKDPLIKQFIEKCLVPASQRLSAAEMLNDPFLSSECSKEMLCDLPHISDALPKLTNLPSTESMNNTSHLSSVEIERHNNGNKFKLHGEKQDSDSISLTLRIYDDPCEPVKKVCFPFFLYMDTVSSIAGEMAEDLSLPNDYVTIISEMINDLVLKLEPSWKPTVGTSCSANSLYDNPLTSDVDLFRTSSARNHGSNDIFTDTVGENYILSSLFEVNNGSDELIEQSFGNPITSHVEAFSTSSAGNHGPSDIFTEAVGEDYLLSLFFDINIGSDESVGPLFGTHDTAALDSARTSSIRANILECSKEVTSYDSGNHDTAALDSARTSSIRANILECSKEVTSYDSGNHDAAALDSARSSSIGANILECSKDTSYDSACSDSDSYFTSFDDISSRICALSLMDKCNEEELCEDLKLELDAIEMDYQRCFSDLMRRRQDAIENLKRKWSTKQKLSSVSCK